MTLRLTAAEFERLKNRKAKSPRSEPSSGKRWEEELAFQLCAAGYVGRFVREYRFVDQRKFRFDFAFVPEQFAIEVDGAVHRIKGRFRGDREKGQIAMVSGWRVLHVGPDQVRNGEALSLVKRLL